MISLASVAALLPPSVSLRLEQVEQQDLLLTLTAGSTQDTRACPLCGHSSASVHSRYERTLADLPVQGLRLRFCLSVRRFYCRVRDCVRPVFCERLEGFARSYRRQTERLNTCLLLLAHALGGNAGARLAERLSLPTSATLLLRRLRGFTRPSSPSPRVVGIDDWAYKRGQRYGTMIVDLERHCVLDLLPDRTTETVAAWLRNHPAIAVVSRDRAGAYADAARQGAPQAQQVADRWHLLQNLTEAVQRAVERYYPHLREVAQQAAEEKDKEEKQREAAVVTMTPSVAEQLRQARQERRQARCAEVLCLHEQGTSIQSIARQLRMHRRLVRQYIRLGAVPPRTPYPRRSCELDAYADYVAQRWQEGCRNSAQLWREVGGNRRLYSVDISKENIATAAKLTRQCNTDQFVSFNVCDSVKFLAACSLNVDLLYLDSYDYAPEEPILTSCQRHQLAELEATVDKLSDRAIVLLDDNNLPFGGKTKLAKERLAGIGWFCLLDWQQSLWVRRQQF